jgi:diaminopimelate epimerase
MHFLKGHGTGNDFVLVPDPDAAVELSPTLVAAICDRRFGIGADGVLRVVRSAKHPEAEEYADRAEWFMDYRNSDGSVSEMCGNGVRVFARYLTSTGLVDRAAFPIATRAGLVEVSVDGDLIGADLPVPVVGGGSITRLGLTTYSGTVVSVGNPHLVCLVPDVSTADLSAPPEIDATVFPEGANVEVIEVADGYAKMRVYERGSAETLSCGSGACAVAAVVLRDAGREQGEVTVDVPGGRLVVAIGPDRCRLSGPAVLVASGDLDLSALRA